MPWCMGVCVRKFRPDVLWACRVGGGAKALALLHSQKQ